MMPVFPAKVTLRRKEMSEIDKAAFAEALFAADGPPPRVFTQRIEDAIRAYEAHKASAVSRPPTDAVGYKEGDVLAIAPAVPDPEEMMQHDPDGVGCSVCNGPCILEPAVAPSTVPEEIAEVVEWCRRKGLGTPPDSMPNRAADLLEGQAREIASLKGEL